MLLHYKYLLGALQMQYLHQILLSYSSRSYCLLTFHLSEKSADISRAEW